MFSVTVKTMDAMKLVLLDTLEIIYFRNYFMYESMIHFLVSNLCGIYLQRTDKREKGRKESREEGRASSNTDMK